MKIRRTRLVAVLGGIVASVAPVAIATPAVATGTTLYVSATGSVGTGQSCASPGYVGATHSSIQSAINAASAGDTVNILSLIHI